MNALLKFKGLIPIVTVILIQILHECRGASPGEDLASLSQAGRDAAARLLREAFRAPSRTNWTALVEGLKLGAPRSNVLEGIQSFIKSRERTGGTREAESELYRLDDLWVLRCTYDRLASGNPVLIIDLQEKLRSVEVQPSDGFSGVWSVYYVNGQKSGEIRYVDGKPDGPSISFYPDGSRFVVNQLNAGVLDGAETVYYPSGSIKHVGVYRQGVQAGTWRWFNLDGSLEAELNFDVSPSGVKK